MTAVDKETRQWLPLHMNGLAECPVRRGDTLVSHEEVISENEQLTVAFSQRIGFERSGNFSVGQFGNFVQIKVMVSTVMVLIQNISLDRFDSMMKCLN